MFARRFTLRSLGRSTTPSVQASRMIIGVVVAQTTAATRNGLQRLASVIAWCHSHRSVAVALLVHLGPVEDETQDPPAVEDVERGVHVVARRLAGAHHEDHPV